MSGKRAPRPEIARSIRQLLDAAERLFELQGLEFSLNELAHEAGLGVATCYRRFQSHDDVVRALHGRAHEAFTAIFDELDAEAADGADGWSTITGYLERAVATNNAHPIFAATARRMARIEPGSTAGEDLVLRLAAHVARAQAEGSLRTDVTAIDLMTLMTELGVLTVFPEPARSAMSVRQLQIMLAGLRAESQRFGDLGLDPVEGIAHLRALATALPSAGRSDSGA